MRISNEKINKAGKTLSLRYDEEAFRLITDYRSLHSIPLARLRTNIHQYFTKRKKANTVTQRLKRIPTIIDKISRTGGTMNVSQMQDIGGLRVIVDDINEVYALQKDLQNKRTDFSFREIRENDYIKIPKPKYKKGGYAYRSLHKIYKFSSENNCNNLQIELQIRTKKQHYWATAVEIIDIIEKQSIKFGKGSSDWHEFFAVVSSLFAIDEKTPIFVEHEGSDREQLLKKFNDLEIKLGAINKLKGIQSIIQGIDKKFKKNTSYALIILDTQVENITRIKEYTEEELSQANKDYSEVEQENFNNKSSQIALLASATGFKKLKEGYLAYFLNTEGFVKELEKFIII